MSPIATAITFFILLLRLENAIAQTITFEKTYGSFEFEFCYDLEITADGGYIIAGETKSFGSDAGYLVKVDSLGIIQWEKTKSHIIRSVQQTTDGGYIGCGGTIDPYDAYLLKTNASGDTEWTQSYGNAYDETARSVQQTTDGGYIFTGYQESPGQSLQIYLVKVSSNGTIEWSKSTGTSNSDAGYSVRQTFDGGFILTGYADGALKDLYLLKTDQNGEFVWTKTYGSNIYQDAGFSVKQTNDNGYIIVGFGGGDYPIQEDIYLVKTDENGELMWAKDYDEDNDQRGYDVEQTTDGGYIVTGIDPSGLHMTLLKISAEGNKEWEKDFAGYYIAEGRSVHQTADGGFVIGGYTEDYGPYQEDFYVVKTDDSGNIIATSLEEGKVNDASISVYPNPFSTTATLEIKNAKATIFNLKIYDLIGNLIREANFNSPTVVIERDNLNNGMYYFKINSNDSFESGKIMIVD